MKKKLILEGLNCANCAAKIEENINKLNTVKKANVNFITKTLVLDLEEESEIEKVKEIIKKTEPDVKVIDKTDKEKKSQKGEFNKNYEMMRLVISLSLFIIALFFVAEEYKLLFFLFAYMISGYKVLLKSLKNIIKGKIFDENFLMSVATVGAISIGEYAEAVGVMVFYEIGEFLQDLAVDNSKRSIKKLLDVRPDYANVVRSGKSIKVSPKEVKKGEIVLVKPGERIPLDGKIIKGSSQVDTSAITGEFVPKVVNEGDKVLSGFVNIKGVIYLEVEKEYSNSTISRIIDMVENAVSKKAKTEKFISKFAKYYTPVVVFLAVGLAAIPSLIFNQNFNIWFYRALIFLVISCPCGLVVSIPLSYFSGIGKLSKNGILVKGGNYIEILKNLKVVIFDKTGTLTEGVFEVVKIESWDERYKDEEILKIAAHAEYHSNHPIADSIRKKYKGFIDEAMIEEYEEISGHGIKMYFDGNEILVGNEKLMGRFNVKMRNSLNFVGTVVYVAMNRKIIGYIGISDRIKDDAKESIERIKKLGVKRVIMLTGDNKKVARNVVDELNIDEFYAELLPEDKANILEKIRKNYVPVAFVGDGINDAPVLAKSDVGIAMGKVGTDIAIEAADVVIMDDKLKKIPLAIRLSKSIQRIIWENIILVLSVKFVFLGLASLGLTQMWGAIFADVGIALIAIMNSLKIFTFKNK